MYLSLPCPQVSEFQRTSSALNIPQEVFKSLVEEDLSSRSSADRYLGNLLQISNCEDYSYMAHAVDSKVTFERVCAPDLDGEILLTDRKELQCRTPVRQVAAAARGG